MPAKTKRGITAFQILGDYTLLASRGEPRLYVSSTYYLILFIILIVAVSIFCKRQYVGVTVGNKGQHDQLILLC